MKSYTINEFLKMVKEGTMFPHYATIVTDYEVEVSTQVTEIAASDKKKRTSEKKVMRRNE